jgi:hypothetical protein
LGFGNTILHGAVPAEPILSREALIAGGGDGDAAALTHRRYEWETDPQQVQDDMSLTFSAHIQNTVPEQELHHISAWRSEPSAAWPERIYQLAPVQKHRHSPTSFTQRSK